MEAMRVARRIEPDVVFGMGALGATTGRAVAVRLKIPNVTRLFGTSLHQFFGKPLRMALRYRERMAFRTPASYIVLCDDGSGGDEVARRLGVNGERFLFWRNGVDKPAFRGAIDRADVRTRLGAPPDGPLVLTVARLHPEKHVERLLAAAPRILAAHPDASFLIVGDGPERGRLAREANELGVERSVVFAGTVPQEELSEVYLAADVFVTLSDRTNAVNPLYEAMMAGLPVVALGTGRTAEFVLDDVNGVLLEPDELPLLAERINALLADDARRERLGREARKTADEALPTIEERQTMEAAVVEAAVAEARGERVSSPSRPKAERTEDR
jgi:glycosyltransferase involved in cell wall biosynthesis